MSAFKDWLTSLTSKSTPVDADELYLRDSSGTPSSKKLTWANLKAMLQTITDTVSAVGGSSAGSALTVNQTWDTTGTPTALKVNVTDTASNAASLLMDLQKNSTSFYAVGKSANGASAAKKTLGIGSAQFQLETDAYVAYLRTNAGSATPLILGDSWISIGSSLIDGRIYRDAAGTLAQRNGTNAQTFRLYNTYTDASNYERGFMRWNSNALEIGAEAAGTGSARAVKLYTGGTVFLSSDTSGNIAVNAITTGNVNVGGNQVKNHRLMFGSTTVTGCTFGNNDLGAYWAATASTDQEWGLAANEGAWLVAKVGVAKAGAYLRINAGSSKKIRLSAGLSASNGYIRSNVAGSFVHLVYDSADAEWVAIGQAGTWTIDS